MEPKIHVPEPPKIETPKPPKIEPYNYDFTKEPWAQQPHHETAIGTDAETSGWVPGKHGIVELGAIGHDYKGNELGRFHTLVNPGDVEFDPEAMKVHGIPMEEIQKAPHIKDVLPAYVDALKKWYREAPYTSESSGKSGVVPKTHLVGHNLQFDLDHLTAAARQHAPGLEKDIKKLSRHRYDTMHHSPVYEKQRTLQGLGNVYGVENPGGHRVMGDSQQALGVYHQQRGQQRMAERLIREQLAKQQRPQTNPLQWLSNKLITRR